MYKYRVRRLGMVIGLAVALAGCIQPVSNTDLTKTAVAPYLPLTQAAAPVATNPPVMPVATTPAAAAPVGISTPISAQTAPLVGQFIQSRGDMPNNLVVWDERSLGPDVVSGFSYSNLNGLPCTGYLLVAQVNGVWQLNNGALVCAQQPGTQALSAVTFFLTSDGQPYSIVFGRVDNPSVTAVAVVYSDNSGQTVNPIQGGFMILKSGVVSATVITAIDVLGNTVIPNIPQSPV